jgi:membrane fusion protein (multidrug efflux system)
MSRIVKTAGGLVVAVMLLLAAGYAVYHFRIGRYLQSTNDATIQADQVTVSSKLAGYVTRIDAADNQRIGKGAVLVEIDATDYRNRLLVADADIGSAEADAIAAQAGEAETRAGIAAAQAGVDAARADLDYTAREVSRYRPLVASGAEPASRLSELTARRERALADLAARQAALDQARRRVASAGAQSGALSARTRAARVSRQAAADDLAATRIAAPIAGTVANRSVRLGQYVQPGMRLLTIVPNEDIYVVANFKETKVGLMRPGQPARITVDALPGIVFTGRVTSVTPGTGANFSLIPPQNATGNFTKIVQRVPVRLKIDADKTARRVLVPGLSLEVEVDTRASAGEIEAIRREQERRRP